MAGKKNDPDREKNITLSPMVLRNRLKHAMEAGKGEAIQELLQQLDVDNVEVLFKAVEAYRKPKGRNNQAQVTDEAGQSHTSAVEVILPSKHGGGRPTLYNEELVEEICRLIEQGNLPHDAAALAGINRATYYEWAKNKDEFAEAVRKAQARFKQRRLAAIQAAGYRLRKVQTPDGIVEKPGGAWQADAWLNERMFPQEFGQQLVIRVMAEDAALLKKQQLTAVRAFELMMQEIAQAVQLGVDWLSMVEARIANMSSGKEHLALPGIIIDLGDHEEAANE